MWGYPEPRKNKKYSFFYLTNVDLWLTCKVLAVFAPRVFRQIDLYLWNKTTRIQPKLACCWQLLALLLWQGRVKSLEGLKRESLTFFPWRLAWRYNIFLADVLSRVLTIKLMCSPQILIIYPILVCNKISCQSATCCGVARHQKQ